MSPVANFRTVSGKWFPSASGTSEVRLAHHSPSDLVNDDSMATMNGENGEPVRWKWLTTEGSKTETMSYRSPLPICWNNNPIVYTRRDVLEENRALRMVAFTVTGAGKAGDV